MLARRLDYSGIEQTACQLGRQRSSQCLGGLYYEGINIRRTKKTGGGAGVLMAAIRSKHRLLSVTSHLLMQP